MQIAKWGNSLAVRLPANLVNEFGLKEGDEVKVVIHDAEIEVIKQPGPLERLKTLHKYRGLIPNDFKFDRDEIHERR